MPKRPSFGQTDISAEARKRHVKRVQWVLQQVWNEFYANKPRINLDLTRDLSIHIAAPETSSRENSRWAQYDQLQEENYYYIKTVPKLLHPSMGVDKSGPTVAVEYRNKGKNRALRPSAKPPISGRLGASKTCPEYSFCAHSDDLIKVWHDHVRTFIPMFIKDDEADDKYCATFQRTLWGQHGEEEVGLNPDYDIIAFEAVSRLKAEGMSDVDIDDTHVLPAHCMEIIFYDQTRKMPAFPTIGPNGEKEWKPRPPKPRPDFHGREGNDVTELFCSRLECGFGCRRHIGDATNEVALSRRPAAATTHTELVIPKEPCSNNCVFHLDKRQLELSDSQEKPQTTFSKDQMSLLLMILPNWEKNRSTYCEAALAFQGPTCQDVALELKTWRTRIMLQEDSKPILDDDGGVLQPAVDTMKDIAKQPDLPITWKAWSMAYCTHLGPCGPNCPCSKRESACERTCHCDASCPRRWRGCKCRADPTNISKKCIPGKCPCRLQHRHCDPGLCACDPPLPGLHSSKGPTCHNLDTRQLGEPKTVVRGSKIPNAGYGLFAAEAIRKGRVIGEYTGEVLGTSEADRRAILYEDVGRNYIYELEDGVYFDGYNYGQVTRFFNGSNAARANVVAEPTNVCGEPRIIIRTSRQIKKGEEMLLDYGADFRKGGGRGVKKARKIRPAKKAKGDKSSRASTASALASSRQGSGVNDNETNMI